VEDAETNEGKDSDHGNVLTGWVVSRDTSPHQGHPAKSQIVVCVLLVYIAVSSSIISPA